MFLLIRYFGYIKKSKEQYPQKLRLGVGLDLYFLIWSICITMILLEKKIAPVEMDVKKLKICPMSSQLKHTSIVI